MRDATQTQSEKALETLQRQGIARLTELMAMGVGQETVARLVRNGRVVRIARGLYQLPDADFHPTHSFAEASKLVPKGVICLISALQFHELTVQLPRSVWMAIPTTARTPRVKSPPIRFVRYAPTILRQGTQHQSIEGVRVSITDPAHTIADCFRFRAKIGLDVALEGMREALTRKVCTADAIMLASQRRRIWTKVKPYLEATLQHD